MGVVTKRIEMAAGKQKTCYHIRYIFVKEFKSFVWCGVAEGSLRVDARPLAVKGLPGAGCSLPGRVRREGLVLLPGTCVKQLWAGPLEASENGTPRIGCRE